MFIKEHLDLSNSMLELREQISLYNQVYFQIESSLKQPLYQAHTIIKLQLKRNTAHLMQYKRNYY